MNTVCIQFTYDRFGWPSPEEAPEKGLAWLYCATKEFAMLLAIRYGKKMEFYG